MQVPFLVGIFGWLMVLIQCVGLAVLVVHVAFSLIEAGRENSKITNWEDFR